MKQKLLKLLSIFVAFLTAIPIANADVTISEPTLVWNKPFSAPGADSHQPIVLPNGKMIVMDLANNVTGTDIKKLYIIDENGVTSNSSGYATVAAGLAVDDNGNVALGFYDTGATSGNQFYLRKWMDEYNNLKGETKLGTTPITLPSGSFSAYTYYYDATGSLDSGVGYIWFPNAMVKAAEGSSYTKDSYYTIRRFKVVNGVYDSYSDYDLGFSFTASNQRSVIQVYYSDIANDKHKFLFQVQGGDLYDCTLENNKVVSSKITGYPIGRSNTNTIANNIFEIQGKKYLVYNTGASGIRGNQFVVWNMTDGTYTTINPFSTATSVSTTKTSYIGSWINSLNISETQTDIFVYSPGVGAAKYTITASNPTVSDVTAETFEARPYVATVSWKAPDTKASKYAVSYSSDGGSTWTSSFETTALSYTFTNLPIGTYTFKVAPYFSETSEWGDEVVSNNIEITAPVFYTFNTTEKWRVETSLDKGGSTGLPGIAVSNEKMYIIAPRLYTSISYVSESLGQSPTSVPSFDSGHALDQFGYGMDNDDAGNIIIRSGSSYSSAPTKFTIYPAGTTSSSSATKTITLTGSDIPLSRADFIAAEGNLLSSAGGYLWFVPTQDQKIYRVKIVNGVLEGVTTWPYPLIASGNTQQVLVRPLPNNQLYIHHRSTGCSIITLPEAGEEITSDMVEKISGVPTATLNSDVFVLKNQLFHVGHDGGANYTIGISIKNLTNPGNGDASFIPFEGINTLGVYDLSSKVTAYGTLVRAIKVDNLTYDIYCYSPGHGVTVYRVSADEFDAVTTPVENLKGEFKFNDVGELWGRQDVVLTWDEPVGYSGATITGYNIYRDNKLQKTVDASTRTFTDINIVASPTYVVAPLYNGVEMNPTDITIDYTFIPIPPVELTARTYDGYGSVQLFWKRTTNVGIKPNYYNIYRDGILVGTSQAFNFYEDKLSAGVHKYEVEAVYNEMDDKYISEEYGRAAKSDPVTINVEARDSEKTTYTLEEIYNYTLDEINNQPANFDNRNYYRQGAYYNGKWYIAQRSDQLCLKDQGVPAGSDYKSTSGDLGSNDARGGVVVFSAEDPRPGVERKPITLLEGTNVGVATDDAGNIFVRQNNYDRLVATRPTDASKTEAQAYVKEDNFSRRMTSGYIYLASSDYSETTRVDVDLTGLDLSNILPDWNTLATDAYVDLACKSQRGRSDYFSLEGDVTSDKGANLYFAPSKSAYVVKVNIKVSGGVATVDVANAQVFDLAGDYKTIDGTDAKVTYGIENYAFPVYGRDAFIGQIRSNGYYGIHGQNDYHPIFTTESRINNSGGTTIEFNNDLFIISPQTMYSASSGDFMVSKGIKSDVSKVATANLSNPLPVATWTQTKQAANVATNASGNWLFAELGTFALSSTQTVQCVYIYQYVPGERIAKYVLFPNNVFPAPPVAINLDPTYRDTEGNEVADENSSTRANEDAVDLLRFDGYAYWAKPNYENDKADKYRYNCYKVKLYQEGDVMPITTEYKLGSAELNALGSETTPKTVIIGNKEFEYNYRLPITNADNKRIWRIEVFATYANIEPGKESDTHDSEVSYDHTSDLYKGVAAEGTVKVYTQPNYPVWVDSKGKVVYKYMHRVDIDFNKPVFDGLRVEPVTHYEIWIDKDKNGEYEEQLKNFNLMTGKYNSATRAEVGTIASQIEVTDGKIVTAEYNPNESKGYALGETESEAHRNSGNYECVLTFYQIGSINPNEGGAMGEGDKSIELNPVNWNYQLRSVYAAGNAKITTTETYDMETGGSPILTGVEAVNGGVSSLKLYPIPTDFILNVESGEPINVIEVYNEVGQLMMSVSGDQTQKMQLDLSDLFDGYYFVKINSNAPVKILKK
ncbi:MAG: T9SS type A sorting domain-containing protein [Muribaculaceae bacterium]|nr:T9SS type A sorting domain-containing protein [Muribaculaceae bacterium]